MEDSKTLLFYLFGLAGLIIVAVLFTGRIESPEIGPLPVSLVPTVTPVGGTVSRTEADQKACSATAQRITMGYIPYLVNMEDNRLTISGTVYASDSVTPLPGVQIKVWRTTPKPQADPRFPPYYALRRTNGAGHYEFIIYKPGEVGQLYYQVRYQDECLLGLQLIFVDVSLQGEPGGALLRGPVDIVLPAPPPGP
ncbi:MAG: hypothetical protein L0Y56_18555 [Nitrospira sp.]|nr:hypothetical protein [Nitrospira sp.]